METMYGRTCPRCGRLCVYKYKANLEVAIRMNTNCKKCSNSLNGRRRTGERNPFYGKHHTEETKDRLRKIQKGRHIHTEEHKDHLRATKKGTGNPRFGKSLMDIWMVKYGREEAERRQKKWRENLRGKSTGQKNGMYGKSPPKGAGSGWGGWYKGWFFRSLLELSYMITVIEEHSAKWESADRSDLRIGYVDEKGRERTYVADFLINDRYLVELKPNAVMETVSVKRKRDSAIKFCKDRQLIYIITSVDLIPQNILHDLHSSGVVSFLPKWEERYKCWRASRSKISNVTETSK